MANDKHVAILKKGVSTWSAWRKKRRIKILKKAGGVKVWNRRRAGTGIVTEFLARLDTRFGRDLTGANLSGAHLVKAHLTDMDLTGANLSGARLLSAQLAFSDLSGANLRGADMSLADL